MSNSAMKLTCILRAAVGHTVHELAEAPAEGSQSCSWRPGLATKTRDQEGAQERPRRGVVAQRASNFLSLRIRSMIRQTGHRVLFFRRVCDKLLLEYITEMRVQMRGHSERSRNAFRAEPFRTFRYPWQPSCSATTTANTRIHETTVCLRSHSMGIPTPPRGRGAHTHAPC